MSTSIYVKDYLNDPNLKDLSVPSSLFIKPDYYTNKVFKNINNINKDNDNVIDENKYKILINNISHSENLTSKSKSKSKTKKRDKESNDNKDNSKKKTKNGRQI